MIKYALIVVIVLIVSVLGIGAYLSPNGLKTCDATPSDKPGCEKVDAIVAISGGNTSVRTHSAVELYKNGWADTLIFSGAAKDVTGPSNADTMRTQAISEGVPSNAIITEGFSQTTHQNARETDAVIEQQDIHRLILVTSPYHQRRAGIEFAAITERSVTIINSPAKDDPDWPMFWWLTPRGWWLAGSELVKILITHAGESR